MTCDFHARCQQNRPPYSKIIANHSNRPLPAVAEFCRMDIYLGFDPGGEKQFGWTVCSSTGHTLQVVTTGRASHAKEAMSKALSSIPERRNVVGFGIDAPLFWAENGGRIVDRLVREAIKKLGAPSPAGTVQEVNSLRGACLVQGALVANLLHKRFPRITATETHPKAMLYLLGIANKQKKPASITLADLSEYASCDKEYVSEHERDAILGAISAFAQRENRKGWRNIFLEEERPVTPFNYPVAYWMPWDLVEQQVYT
jgi:hypothetical protein